MTEKKTSTIKSIIFLLFIVWIGCVALTNVFGLMYQMSLANVGTYLEPSAAALSQLSSMIFLLGFIQSWVFVALMVFIVHEITKE
ncbi:MAG: hypothetical protein ACW99G_13835 [Candidatus Thorarchaeota archaeon]|jgi:hypothetical protein